MSDHLQSGPADRWQTDILIIGAGPAGTAAAIEATRRGYETVVVDKARFPRDKCCGDGLTTGALRHLEELGFEPSSVASWQPVSSVSIRGPEGVDVDFGLPKGNGTFAAVCRRVDLDNALVELARKHGARVLEGHELESISQTATSVETTVNGVVFTSRYVIAADGMWSPTRGLLGLKEPDYRGEWHGFRQYFSNVSERASSELIVWFEPDLLPGYAWSFPLPGGGANVGFGIQRGHNYSIQDMKRIWPELLARPHIASALGPDAKPDNAHRAWPIPARLGKLPLSDGRVLFVGDAAAATDPMTGEGIGQALETGRDAATAICRAGPDDPSAATESYEATMRRGMGLDHWLAAGLSKLLSKRQSTSLALSVINSSDWTRRNFVRWLFEDYPRAALLTPRRWHRQLFSSPGAYRDSAPTGMG